jgi:hypothetical protein
MGLSRNHFQLNSGRSPVRSQLRPFSSRRFNSPVYDLDWPVPVETDNRSRCGRSLVRCGLTSAWRCPCQAFWVVRSSARHQRRTQLPFLQSVLGESESIHSRTLGLWRMCIWCCRVCSFWFGFDVSVAAIRRSPNTSLPGWRSRWSERCDTRSERHSQRSERRNASSAEAAGGASAANVASSMVPNYRGGSNCRGVVSSRARWGATAWVDPGLSLQVGRSR